MFDISSDDELFVPSRRGGHLLPRPLEQVDAEIRGFLSDNGKAAYSLPPMDKQGRKKIHMLAECYGLKSKSKGKGSSRFTQVL